jgi:predicted transcriptional regulator
VLSLANYSGAVGATAYADISSTLGERSKGAVGFSRKALGFKNRDRATIIADILNTLVNNPKGKRKTNIRQSANLSSYMSDKYLEFLLHNDFIKIEEGGIYKTTTKGLRLLQNLDINYIKMAYTF